MKKRFTSLVLAVIMLFALLPSSAPSNASALNPFTDVPDDAWFTETILWAVGEGITDGITPTTFGPDEPCTRSQMVTFLLRSKGCPTPTATECKFEDVDLNAWYAKALLWAVETGITDGVAATKFAPDDNCTRSQMVTFLWRMAGKPAPSVTDCTFTDVKLAEWYGSALLWAVEQKITQGITTTFFGTERNCTRAETVTFLYRMAHLDLGGDNAEPPELAPLKSLANKEFGVDYVDLYETFGKPGATGVPNASAVLQTQAFQPSAKGVTIDMVIEDPNTGMAMLEINGVLHTLGMNFLSYAMIYNTSVPGGGKWKTEDDVYATWWKYYMTRWNYLMPELPLYSNEYYHLYNTKIHGVAENPLNPYWNAASALIDWTSTKADKSIHLGSSTGLSGRFRYSSFGSSTPGSSDLDIQNLIVGLETVSSTKDGAYVWNDTVVKKHTEVTNADGSKTYTIQLHDDLKFSDGSKVTAKNYLAQTLVFSTPVATKAAGRNHMAGMKYVGYEDFKAYNGKTGKKEFSGVRLIDELTFSVTVDPEYLPYYYSITYASFSAQPTALWLGNADIRDDGNGCYLTSDFYAQSGENYTMAKHIHDSAWDTTDAYPYSGPYMVDSVETVLVEDTDESYFYESVESATLVKNPHYKGNYEGTKPGIEKVLYKRAFSGELFAQLESGELDIIIDSITGGEEIQNAIDFVSASKGAFSSVHYSRAGYGALQYRADFGPVQFTEVRNAVAYLTDRKALGDDFCDGYAGNLPNGAYYDGFWAYKEAVKLGMKLNSYKNSAETAIKLLEDGGWVYNAQGGAYTSGVRYKKIPAAEMQSQDITFASVDGKYKTVKLGDDYYMPLVLNWFGTTDNAFSDAVEQHLFQSEAFADAGFEMQYKLGEFDEMYDELYQQEIYGYYGGTPTYTCFNMATGLGSAVYDYSDNWTIDPELFDYYTAYYLKDLADAYWLK